MGKPTGFLEYQRETASKRSVAERVQDYNEIELPASEEKSRSQAARCMDCGIPFCHNGCPLGNIIPEFNDAVYEQNWEYAYQILASTNNFPEFTGRICPAPCESSCVLGINKPPVAIEFIEKSIIETAFEKGYVKPTIPNERTDKKIAVIGSGPAGLAAAAQLNKAGHWVTVFERADQIGGLVRYGIPDFKLDKKIVDRRVDVMKASGIEFKTGVNVGFDVKGEALLRDFDAIVLSGGSTVPRDIPIKGRELNGIHFAMDFLSQQNKRVAARRGLNIDFERSHAGKKYEKPEILANEKNILVIGGGDTGSDCVGTSNRHGAKSITQVEVMWKPELDDKTQPYYQVRDKNSPWPNWPITVRTSTSHEEGVERQWSIYIKEFIGEKGDLKAVKMADYDWSSGKPVEIPGSERVIDCELALIAAGFLHPQQDLIVQLGIEVDERSRNIIAPQYKTNNEKVFAAGDMRRGQSLVVWAISEGRECARKVDEYLMGESMLEAKALSMITPEYAGV